MPGCKPGDMAKFAKGHPNADRVCAVLKRSDVQLVGFPEALVWEIKPLQPMYNFRRKIFTMLVGWAPDDVLIPIRPGDLDGEHPGDKLVEPTVLTENVEDLNKRLEKLSCSDSSSPL